MQLKSIAAAAAAFATLAFASGAAHAEPYLFTLSGAYSASWELESSPTPDGFGPYSFGIWDAPGNFPDSAQNIVSLGFWLDGAGPALQLADMKGTPNKILASLNGPQLFTGTIFEPTFTLGTYTLNSNSLGEHTLTISAVPEPSTALLALAGLGVMVAVRRRNQSRDPRSAA